jgi:hypothetical protein
MILEKELLKNTYNGNIFKTATLLRESVQTIMASLKKHKIEFEKPKHIYSGLRNTDFSGFQKSLLIGSVLGDGHIEKRSHLKNALFREEHSIDQVEWLKWKHRNLKPFTTADMWNRDRGEKALMPDGKGGRKQYNIQNVCAMSTGTHPYLTKLHDLFYENRVKVLPKRFIKENFDLVTLAVLIGDDGNFCENSIRICTDNFNKDDVYLLADLCSMFYNSRITVREEKKDKYRIVFTKITRDLGFFDKLKKILPKCMHHKISPVLNEHQVATH